MMRRIGAASRTRRASGRRPNRARRLRGRGEPTARARS
jgi:hypothetical protein